MPATCSDADADGGTAFTPTVVNTEAELAELVRLPTARNADKLLTILEETGAALIKLESSWWGNEAFGMWGEWWLIQPDGTSDGGALFVDEGIAPSDPIKKLNFAERVTSDDSHGGYTSKAARKERRKAFNWADNSKKPGPGMLSTDERDRVTGVSCPLSVVELAIRAPESADNLIIEDGDLRRGKLSEGDLRVEKTKRTKYGRKAILQGDTYDLLSSKGENLSDEITWDTAHCTFDGDHWVCDDSGAALKAVASALNDAGYTLALAESFGDKLMDPDEGPSGESLRDAFGGA